MHWDSALPGELKAHKRGILVLRGPRPRRSVIAAATALVVSLGWAVAGAAAPAMASSCGNNGTTWKQVHLGLLGDGDGGQLAVDMSDSWGGANTCLYVFGTTSDFGGSWQVQSQTAPYTGGVLGYPDTEIGCSSGYCTTASGLPAPVSANPDPDLTWYYDTNDAVRGSKYDALIDSEFSAACSGSAPPMNAAVAIYTYGYPSYPSIGVPHSGPTVSIDGLDWYTGHFLDGSKYVSQFVLAQPDSNGGSGLTLGDFYQWVQANLDSNYMPSGDCLQTVSTGFEIWSGGQGLGTYNSAIDGLPVVALPTPSPSPSPSASASVTPTPSPSFSDSSSPSPTDTPTDTPSDSSSDSATPTPSPSSS
jgi:hypothetical protein